MNFDNFGKFVNNLLKNVKYTAGEDKIKMISDNINKEENNIISNVIDSNTLNVILQYEIEIKPEDLTIGFKDIIYEKFISKYIHRPYGVFYILSIKYDKDKINFPLMNLNHSYIYLNMETKIYLEYIGNIIDCNIYFNKKNELVGETQYIYCVINIDEYQKKIVRSNENTNEINIVKGNKNYKILEKESYKVRIINFNKSDGLDKIYANGLIIL